MYIKYYVYIKYYLLHIQDSVRNLTFLYRHVLIHSPIFDEEILYSAFYDQLVQYLIITLTIPLLLLLIKLLVTQQEAVVIKTNMPQSHVTYHVTDFIFALIFAG